MLQSTDRSKSIFGTAAQAIGKAALDGLSVALLKLDALDEKAVLYVRLANKDLDPMERSLVLDFLDGKIKEFKLLERFAQVSYWRDKAYEGWGDEDSSKEAMRAEAYTWVLRSLGIYSHAASVFAQVASQVYLPPEEQKELSSRGPGELFGKAYQIEQEMGDLIHGSKLKQLVNLEWRAWQSACEAAGIDYNDSKAKEREGWYPDYIYTLDKIIDTPEITDDAAALPSFIQRLKSDFEKYAVYLLTDELEPEEGLLLQTISNNLQSEYLAFQLWPEVIDRIKGNITIPPRLAAPLVMNEFAERTVNIQPDDLPREVRDVLMQMGEFDYVRQWIAHITITPEFVDAAQKPSPNIELDAIAFPVVQRVLLEGTKKLANCSRIPLSAWEVAGVLVHEATHISDTYNQLGKTGKEQLPYEMHAYEQQLNALERYQDPYDQTAIDNEIGFLKVIVESAKAVQGFNGTEGIYPAAETIIPWLYYKKLPEILEDGEIGPERKKAFADCLNQQLFGTEACAMPEISFRL